MTTLTLGDCCSMQTGIPVGRADFAESGETGVIQLKDINPDGRLSARLERVRLARDVRGEKRIRNDDILLKGRGGNITATLITNAPENTIASAAFFILRPKPDVLPGFLTWYLNTMRLPVMQGTTIPMLHLGDLKAMPLHLPPLPVQRQIVDGAGLIAEARALSDRYYEKLGRLLKGMALKSGPGPRESL